MPVAIRENRSALLSHDGDMHRAHGIGPTSRGAGVDGTLVCGDHVMDGVGPDTALAWVEHGRPAWTPLQDPCHLRWRRDALVQAFVAGSAATGEAVRADILSSSTVAAEGYALLMDLNVGYPLVSDIAAFGGITAWSAGHMSPGAAVPCWRGLTVWSVSYFMGLTSSASEGPRAGLHGNVEW